MHLIVRMFFCEHYMRVNTYPPGARAKIPSAGLHESDMSVRVFSCHHCGHMLRLGAVHCGRCGGTTPLRNWTLTHLAGVFLLLLVAAAGIAMLPTAG